MKTVEIRNQLTLELITILQPTKTIPRLMGPLAYSPDGRSIACASYPAITIWDIQTGGVAEEIECSAKSISLVWSPDGQTLCTINEEDQVTTYNVSSRTTLSPGTLQSGYEPYLWTDDNSFWVLTVRGRYYHSAIDIFKVGSTLTKIRSFVFPLSEHSEGWIGSFSPATHRISISGGGRLRIFDIQNSQSLLDTRDDSRSYGFSPDGSLFAASQRTSVRLWKYSSGKSTSGCYTLWGELPSRGWPDLQFSPTPSSILRQSENTLQVLRLHKISTTLESSSRQYVRLSRSGARAVTAHRMGRVVTIIDLLGQTPPQYIDTCVAIQELVLTGNVLIVAGWGEVVAWLLTEEGLVGGVIGGRRVGRSDTIWSIPVRVPLYPSFEFLVEGYVGAIRLGGDTQHVYHTETGEVLHSTQARDSNGWQCLGGSHWGRDYLYYHKSPQRNTTPKDSWQTSYDTLREGWVKDPEGKHRLWVPVEWRTDWDLTDWLHDVTTQFSRLGGGPVLIKF